MTSDSSKEWFKEVTVYQIYPSSFCDSGSSGTGNLAGITSKVDYLHNLGVDVVWLSPIYSSPWKDAGYDISDYRNIREEYGTLEDWDKLKDELHKRGMKLMMDLVVNHSSDEHEWFQQSRSSKTNPYRDFYIWQPAKTNEKGERVPPNNWESVFGGESAWEWDEKTEEYYLRLFVKEQPDLNWENPAVREAVYDVMKFWLDRGCDGFRDQARSVTRFANDSPEYRARSAKVLATLHNSLCGTVYIYEGDEIGMKNIPKDWTIEDFPDVATQMYWKTQLKERKLTTGESDPDMSDILQNVLQKARDNARTPMQWNNKPHAGFTTGKPWMRVNDDFADGWNVEDQLDNPDSVLNYWTKVLKVRKANPVLVHGDFTLLDRANPCIFAYLREWKGSKALIVLSFTPGEVVWDVPDEVGDLESAKLLIGTLGEETPKLEKERMIKMAPFEGRIYLL
ncbi:hypothetical protein P7C70_g4567, partial [Phenoliferia sp. Uapishka_3]